MRFRPSFPTATLPSLAIALAFAGGARAEPAADGGAPATHPGAAIYQMQCVECHGEHGEGNELEEVDALYGDRSVASLTRLIERTMPEEDPETCVGDDARAVAQYIYDAFYSPAARERMGAGEQARVGLVRMTVPQYRNAVADLLGRFERGRRDAGEGEPGLRGSYFSSDGMNKKAGKPVERRDLAMQFDFGEGPPAEGLNAEQYSVVWEGSFFARETGHYEFRTTTPNGVRLYANVPISSRDRNYRDDSSGGRAALIDDWVSSGAEDRVSTARVYLLGGRRYPLRLDYFKYKEKLGRVTLEWKPPGGVWEVLGGDVLSTSVPAKTFVVSAPFPPDDRSQGYERGLSVSKDWHAGVTAGAVEVAREVVERIDRLSGIRGDDPERAIPELLRIYGGMLNRILAWVPQVGRQEIINETLYKAWVKRHQYDRERGSFSVWFLQIARRCAIDRWRQENKARLKQAELRARRERIAEIRSSEEFRELRRRVMGALEPGRGLFRGLQRAVLIADIEAFPEAISGERLGALLGTGRDSIYSQRAKAYKKLKDQGIEDPRKNPRFRLS